MKIALLGDTHGRLDERIAALVRGCDLAVHTGDVGGQGVLDQLQPKQDLVVVRGNNDTAKHWGSAGSTTLAQLPEQRILDLPGGALAVIHGHQWAAKNRHARLRAAFPRVRAIVYGHSHRLATDKQPRPWVLNPGAAGRTRTYGGPACLVLTASEPRWRLRAVRYAKA